MITCFLAKISLAHLEFSLWYYIGRTPVWEENFADFLHGLAFYDILILTLVGHSSFFSPLLKTLCMYYNTMGRVLALFVTGLSVFCARLIVQRWRRSHAARQRGCESPRQYPHKEPFLGLDLFFNTGNAIQGHRFLPVLTNRYNTLGNTFQSTILGFTNINSIEPENLHTVFSSRSEDWGVEPVRLAALFPFCGRGFITTDGASYERSRSMLRPSFHKGNAIHLPTLEHHFKDLLTLIPKDGSTVDLQPLLYSLVSPILHSKFKVFKLTSRQYLDTATLFLFGESANSLSKNTTSETQTFLQAFDHAMLGSEIRIHFGPFKFLYPYIDTKWLKSCAVTHRFVDRFVEMALDYRRRQATKTPSLTPREDDSKSKPILLHAIAEQTEDTVELRYEILQALMAAQETTATLISNAFFLLSRHSLVWKKLHNEVLAIGDKEVDVDCLQGLTYLRQVLNESESHQLLTLLRY